MKNFVAKLKGLNYKQLVVDHGEKGLLGFVGFLVLIFLVGTSWSRYDKLPEEFTKKVKQGEDNIQASFDNGVLHLTLPKRDEVKPRKIKVH